MRFLLRAALGAGLSILSLMADDLTITFRNGGRFNEGVSRQFMTADRHRTNHEGTRTDTLVDFGKEMIYTIKHKEKAVEFMSFADMEKAAELMAAKMEELQRQMADAPPFVRQMMGDPSAFSVDKVGADTVAGRKCDKFKLVVMKMEMFLSVDPALKMPMNPANFARFTRMANLMRFMGSPGAAKLAAEMSKIKGVTLRSVMQVPMVGEMTSEATEVKEGPIAPGVFALPSGYRMEDVGKKMMEQARKAGGRPGKG